MVNVVLESEIEDKQGNIVISPGLKVRHKKSQYEYAVDSVIDNDGEIEVILRLPDEPRFEPESSTELIQSKSKNNPNIMYEVDPSAMFYEPDNFSEEIDDDEPELISVTEKEFEKDYEVK